MAVRARGDRERSAAHRRQRAALTRTQKLGPGAVLDACLAALDDFADVGWPDDWPTWAIAFRDALEEAERRGKDFL